MTSLATAYVGLGSNLGEKQKNCEAAVTRLQDHPQINVLAISRWHVTRAVCLPGETQPDFVNGALKLETLLSAPDLQAALKKMERELGREPDPKKWQPRLIDLDLLFYSDQISEWKDVKIPHPLAHKRLFVLEPLVEIAPNLVHPVLKKSIQQLLEEQKGAA